jgi:trehalose 6-phosphate synthase
LSRIVAVSNRVVPVVEGKTSVGGLAVAVLAAIRKHGGIWFGWSGDTVPSPSPQPKMFKVGRLSYATIDLSPRDHAEYYTGFANRSLWPLLHYRLDLTSFHRRDFNGYVRVNRRFAESLAPLLEPDDLVWVHDYHLIPLGQELRQAGARQPTGFFLHTPFPVPEILEALPGCEWLMRALCAYDVVGFQTELDLRAFQEYIEYNAGGTVLPNGEIEAYGRRFLASAFPIGIDVESVARDAEKAVTSMQTRKLLDSARGKQIIIGVDRLDYSKGLAERFRAFQRLLEIYPDNRGVVSFIQIAPPSRTDVPEYGVIRRELETTAGHINGLFAELEWVPIRYLNRSFSRRALAGFFRVSRVAMVTPLRDGMNLVAKEYIAAQDPKDPGVLVLSRFAGAACELTSAILVNPYDQEEVAEALERALKMPLDERRKRWQGMMTTLRQNDVAIWRDRFLGALSAQAPCAQPPYVQPPRSGM